MPRYYCDYCDTYLTHDSPSVRKQHNAGYKHKANVRTYYQQYEAELNQSLIDQKVKEHLGAFRPPVAPYPQLRPLMPGMPLPGQYPPGHPGFRPPMMPMPMPRPMPGAPGYLPGPPMQMQMPQMMPPPGTAPMPPGQMNGLPQQFIPGSSGIPSSGAPPPMFAPPPSYQVNPPPVTTGGGDNGAPTNFEGQDADQ